MRLAKRKSVQRALYVLGCCALAFLNFGTLQKTMTAEREHALAGGFSARSETYSDDAADMFGYILSDTAEDAVIAYYKPRALYLNTNRVSFQPTGERARHIRCAVSADDERAGRYFADGDRRGAGGKAGSGIRKRDVYAVQDFGVRRGGEKQNLQSQASFRALTCKGGAASRPV